jgi:hypothetical protein
MASLRNSLLFGNVQDSLPFIFASLRYSICTTTHLWVFILSLSVQTMNIFSYTRRSFVMRLCRMNSLVNTRVSCLKFLIQFIHSKQRAHRIGLNSTRMVRNE